MCMLLCNCIINTISVIFTKMATDTKRRLEINVQFSHHTCCKTDPNIPHTKVLGEATIGSCISVADPEGVQGVVRTPFLPPFLNIL